MIKYFRRLRQKILLLGNTNRYLAYAAGEILLVVIGILIALSINNWNINRIEKKNERIILNDLQVEFNENLNDAERVLAGNYNIYKAISKIQAYNSSVGIDRNELDSLMYAVFDWFDYTPKPGASNNLINSGNLNLISNRDLRKLLTLWPGVNDELDDDEKLAIHYSQTTIIPYLAKHYPIQNLEKFDMSDAYYETLKADDNNVFNPVDGKVYDPKALLEDPVFQSHMSTKKIYARHNTLECHNVIQTCRSILELIQSELQKQ